MKINYIYIMAALVCACFASCTTSESEVDTGDTREALVPLNTINLGGTASVTPTAKIKTRDGNLQVRYFLEVETSFAGHDGSSADKPLSVAYYYTTESVYEEDILNGQYGVTDPLRLTITPISHDLLSAAGYSTSGTTSDGALLVPASGEFRMRIHGFSDDEKGDITSEYLQEIKPQFFGEATGTGYEFETIFWNGTVKMNGSSLIATKDDYAPGQQVDASGSISLRLPFAVVSFNIIGAYGEATEANPYLDPYSFRVNTKVLNGVGNSWKIPATTGSGTPDMLTAPWLLGETVGYEESPESWCLIPDGSHVDATAADGTKNILFTIKGDEGNTTYSNHTYNLYVPAGGVTYKAGYKYTYHVRLTESTATIESVTISNYTDDGSYTIDMDGNVSDDNSK